MLSVIKFNDIKLEMNTVNQIYLSFKGAKLSVEYADMQLRKKAPFRFLRFIQVPDPDC